MNDKQTKGPRYWYVEWFDDQGRLDHNAVCASFEDIASQSKGRRFVITGEASHDDYVNAKAEGQS
jgi:hypothetical protein